MKKVVFRLGRNLGDFCKNSYNFVCAQNNLFMPMFNFNKQVWRALKLIPRGRVTTYKEIAKYLGKPKAARAVGNACGKNPDAPAAPCHRVVKSDGGLGGYSGEAKKKIKLLKREGVEAVKNKILNFEKKLYRFK